MSEYHNDMEDPVTISMDAAGRLVIPAAVRKELALVGGADLVVEVHGGTIQLRPAGNATLARRGRRLVVRSALVGDVPDHRELREERAAKIAGK